MAERTVDATERKIAVTWGTFPREFRRCPSWALRKCPSWRRAVHLAESFLASGDGPGGAGGNGGERYQIFVHLDEDVLGEPGDWTATLDDGTRLPAETLRRLACDCGLVPTRTNGEGSVLDVGRRTRSIPPAIRRALWLRDRGCRFPGCGHTRFLHGHHLHHWLAGGETRLDNLVLVCSLCRARHKLHYAELRIMPSSGGASTERQVSEAA